MIFNRKMKILLLKNHPLRDSDDFKDLGIAKGCSTKVLKKNDEFSIKNDEFCILKKHDEFCIRNDELCIIKMMNFALRSRRSSRNSPGAYLIVLFSGRCFGHNWPVPRQCTGISCWLASSLDYFYAA